MQYFKPPGRYFVGDCMPFFHDGTFHLFYLLDENHHQGLNGLGGHQWAHASSADLIHWTQHPMALSIDEDWEGSICTGSVFFHQGTFYAFYATRFQDWHEHLSYAVSSDGIHFTKQLPNPFASPPPSYGRHYRDPTIFPDPGSGLFHMLVTAEKTDGKLRQRGGCLAHLTSPDLKTWKIREPFLMPGYPNPPECPDHFYWNGWYYLLFSHFGVTRYRMARSPFGPWIRPAVDTFENPISRVMKTAAFSGNRRIGVSYLASRSGNQDDGRLLYAGNAVFRELVQHSDGSLGTKFPKEMVPEGTPITPTFTALHGNVNVTLPAIKLEAEQGIAAGCLAPVHVNSMISLTVHPLKVPAQLGLVLRGGDDFDSGCTLGFYPHTGRVALGDQFIEGVERLDKPYRLDIILHGDILDICIDQRRCIINRCPESRGSHLYVYCMDGKVLFDHIAVKTIP